jgi:hypothetical protein
LQRRDFKLAAHQPRQRLGDRAGTRELYRYTTAWLVLVTWPLYLLVAAYAPVYLRLFGPEYRGGTPVVVTLAAAMLVATGWIHLDLWLEGYRDTPWIGPLFMANVVLAFLAAVAVLLAPPRWLPWVALLAGLLELGTLGGLVLSMTVGLFGFFESIRAHLVVPTIVVESAGFLVLVGYAGWELSRQRGRRT